MVVVTSRYNPNNMVEGWGINGRGEVYFWRVETTSDVLLLFCGLLSIKDALWVLCMYASYIGDLIASARSCSLFDIFLDASY